jgi:heme exporter protein CcmD
MDGHAGFVWSAYAVAFVVLGGLSMRSWLRYRRSTVAVDQLQRERGTGR